MEKYINEIQKLVNRIKEESKDNNVETGWFELDNLDEAKLLSDELGRIFIENEHATTFDLEELSDVEFIILIGVLKEELKDVIKSKEYRNNQNILAKFVNGFDSWIETYSEVSRIIREVIEQENPIIQSQYEQTGYGLIYELSIKITDEFETMYKGKEWDGDWFDTLEEFVYGKFKVN
jgi:hypothetical protein